MLGEGHPPKGSYCMAHLYEAYKVSKMTTLLEVKNSGGKGLWKKGHKELQITGFADSVI